MSSIPYVDPSALPTDQQGPYNPPDQPQAQMQPADAQAPQIDPQQIQQGPTAQPALSAPPAAAAPAQPFWKTLLRGALSGLAGGAGAHNWGQALGLGAGAEMKQEQQDFQNQQQQQAQASQIRFRDAQDAYNAATLTQNQQKLDMLKTTDRSASQAAADKHAQMLQSLGATVTPIGVGPSGSGPATAFLTQASTHPDGASVSGWSVPGPDTMYAVSFDGENGPQAQYQVYAKSAKAFGLPVFDKTMVLGLPRQKQMTTEQLPQQFLLGSDEQGKPYGKGNEAQLRTAITTAQSKVKELNGQPEDSRDNEALTMWQTRLSHLNTTMSAVNDTNQAAADRQTQTAVARGKAMGDYRYDNFINPQTQEVQRGYNKDIAAAGAAPAGPGMKAGSAQAQINDIATGSQAMRQAIHDVTPLSIAQVGELSTVMNHDGDPSIRADMLKAFLNKNTLSDAQKNFVVAANQLNERALSLRSVAGMGNGSDQLRSAIRSTLPGAASGDKSLMLKQLDAFDQQVNVLAGGMAKARGLAGNTGTQAFTVNGTTYHIPADKVAEFKKDHPNAR